MIRAPALFITRYGGPEVFEVREVTVPPPGPGQVRVDVRAAGINFAEVFCRLGLYRHAPPPPFVPGFEFAGVVVDAGPGIGFQPGQPVLGVSRFGGYQGALLADAARVRPIPEGWSMTRAAALPTAALTAAYGLLEPGNLRRGETVVVHSAAGGVGQVAVQIALAMGARVVGTTGSDAKLPVLRDLGCSLCLNYKDHAWADVVRREVGTVHVVFDALGGTVTRQGYELLGPRGRLVCYGLGSMTPTGNRVNPLKLAWHYLKIPRFSIFPLISDNKVVAGFNVLLLWDEVEVLSSLFDRCLGWARAGVLSSRVSEEAPFEQVGELHARLQSGTTTGKLVLTFPPG